MALVTGASVASVSLAQAPGQTGMSLCLTAARQTARGSRRGFVRSGQGANPLRRPRLGRGPPRARGSGCMPRQGRLGLPVHPRGASTWDRCGGLGRSRHRLPDQSPQPFLLTKALLPLLRRRAVRSCREFICRPRRRDRQRPYAATKHALRSLAGSIRDQVNPWASGC